MNGESLSTLEELGRELGVVTTCGAVSGSKPCPLTSSDALVDIVCACIKDDIEFYMCQRTSLKVPQDRRAKLVKRGTCQIAIIYH
jgi:hypothetical protein